MLLEEVFGSKQRINLVEFSRINQKVSSDMFLTMLILLQNSLPCTENFNRYQKNFEKYISTEGNDPKKATNGPDGQIITIASPRMVCNLPLKEFAGQHGINFNPPSTKNMLSFNFSKSAAPAN